MGRFSTPHSAIAELARLRNIFIKCKLQKKKKLSGAWRCGAWHCLGYLVYYQDWTCNGVGGVGLGKFFLNANTKNFPENKVRFHLKIFFRWKVRKNFFKGHFLSIGLPHVNMAAYNETFVKISWWWHWLSFDIT